MNDVVRRARWDFVIVGGGSAGSVLANRLSKNGARVLVLEAGRRDWAFDIFLHMPSALTFPIGSRFYDWQYRSEPEPHMNGRRVCGHRSTAFRRSQASSTPPRDMLRERASCQRSS